MPLHAKLSLFAYVISGERSANRPKKLRNDAFQVKTSQSAKNQLNPAKNENRPKFDIRPFCTKPFNCLHVTATIFNWYERIQTCLLLENTSYSYHILMCFHTVTKEANNNQAQNTTVFTWTRQNAMSKQSNVAQQTCTFSPPHWERMFDVHLVLTSTIIHWVYITCYIIFLRRLCVRDMTSRLLSWVPL